MSAADFEIAALQAENIVLQHNLSAARSFIVRILVECGPGSHPGRTPEEAADEIIEGKK